MFLVKIKNDSGNPAESEITVKQIAHAEVGLQIVEKDMDFDQAKEDMVEYGPGFIVPVVEFDDGRNTTMIASDGDTTFAYIVK